MMAATTLSTQVIPVGATARHCQYVLCTAREPSHTPARIRATRQHETASRKMPKSKSTIMLLRLAPDAAVARVEGMVGVVIES